MSFEAVVNGYKQKTVALMPDQESIVRNHLRREEVEVIDAVQAVQPPATMAGNPPVKRKGGWPKGKARGPRIKPAVLA